MLPSLSSIVDLKSDSEIDLVLKFFLSDPKYITLVEKIIANIKNIKNINEILLKEILMKDVILQW